MSISDLNLEQDWETNVADNVYIFNIAVNYW